MKNICQDQFNTILNESLDFLSKQNNMSMKESTKIYADISVCHFIRSISWKIILQNILLNLVTLY